MIESRSGSHRFPGSRYVTGLAGAFERRIHESPAMRIDVAILATGEAQSLVSGRSTARRRRVALHALDVLMPAGQRIRGTAVIEARSRLPGVLRMAVRAFVTELPAVLILMAADTLRRQPKEGIAEILDLYLGLQGSHDMLRVVAILAAQALVFSYQRKVGKGVMFEPRLVNFCDLERAAVMFQVTTSAVGLASRNVECTRVVSVLLLDSLSDLGMAFQAFEPALPESKVMASGALGRAFQVLVSLGQGARRDLSGNRTGQIQYNPR